MSFPGPGGLWLTKVKYSGSERQIKIYDKIYSFSSRYSVLTSIFLKDKVANGVRKVKKI